MTEKEIIEILSKDNEEFRKLGEEHRDLETKLSDLSGRVYLTPEEEMEKKTIQKMKLAKKDRMAELITIYRKEHSLN